MNRPGEAAQVTISLECFLGTGISPTNKARVRMKLIATTNTAKMTMPNCCFKISLRLPGGR